MTDQPTGVLAQIGARLGRLMRITRILLCMLISIALTMFAWLVLASVFGEGVTDPHPGPIPAIAVVLGMVVYVITWWAMIGFKRRKTVELPQDGALAAVLLMVGGVALVLDVIISIAIISS